MGQAAENVRELPLENPAQKKRDCKTLSEAPKRPSLNSFENQHRNKPKRNDQLLQFVTFFEGLKQSVTLQRRSVAEPSGTLKHSAVASLFVQTSHTND